tara:strand:+ start:18 stop:356 length:339 start_codon:yes stop_codon:yes gene_type:complete
MIKKLNRDRFKRKKPLPKWYFEEDTKDYTRIFMQLFDIEMELKGLRDRIWIQALRTRYAIAHTKSFHIKTKLKFQEKIILQHINDIERLQEENKQARNKNYEREYGHDLNFF